MGMQIRVTTRHKGNRSLRRRRRFLSAVQVSWYDSQRERVRHVKRHILIPSFLLFCLSLLFSHWPAARHI